MDNRLSEAEKAVLIESNDVYTFDILDILQSSWKIRKKIFVYSFILTAVVAALTLLMPNKYSATASILPSGEASALSQYSSIANLVGISLPGSANNDALVPDIILSNRQLNLLIDKKWKSVKYDSLVTLYDLFEIELDDSDPFPELKRKEALVKHLRENVIFVEASKVTGIIRVTVVLPREQKLTADITNEILSNLDDYNRTFRKSKSLEEKVFLEKRMTEVYEELGRKEDELKNFEESYRDWSQSPSLKLRWAQINRDVTVTTSMWIELKKQYELTKLAVEREKVTFDVLDFAKTPATKDSPRRSLICIFVFVASILVQVLWFYYRNTITGFINSIKS